MKKPITNTTSSLSKIEEEFIFGEASGLPRRSDVQAILSRMQGKPKGDIIEALMDELGMNFGAASEYASDSLQEASKKPVFADVDEEDDGFEDDGEYLDSENDDEMPEEFLFESKMIFLSNMLQIPPAVGDRCITIGLHYTKDQALDLIEHKLEHLCPEYPELTLAMKKKIVNFMRKHQRHAVRFSFRSFLHIAALYMSGNPDWEKWALIQMKSLPV